MRIKEKIKDKPKNYSERVIEKFLLFPKKLYSQNDMDCKEFRWLEKCKVVQFYSASCNGWIDYLWYE